MRMVCWPNIDTVIFDMDGTLLDLKYDNTLWNSELPKRFATLRGIQEKQAWKLLYDRPVSKLDYYSLDYWQDFTGLDIAAIHWELISLIQYRANAKKLIFQLHKLGIRCVIATNAHPKVFEIKNHVTFLDKIIDKVYCALDFSSTKEDLNFWEKLHYVERFQVGRTLFIDDNIEVLDTASRFGLQNLLTIDQPASGKPRRSKTPYKSINDFSEIFPND